MRWMVLATLLLAWTAPGRTAGTAQEAEHPAHLRRRPVVQDGRLHTPGRGRGRGPRTSTRSPSRGCGSGARTSAGGACRRAPRSSPAATRTASNPCGWTGPYPASTYDPKSQCPFWPARFRDERLPDGPDRQVAHRRRRRVRPGLGLPGRVEPAEAPGERRVVLRETTLLAFNGEEKWQDGYPGRQLHEMGRRVRQRARTGTRANRGSCGSVTGASTARRRPSARHKGDVQGRGGPRAGRPPRPLARQALLPE